MVLTIIPTMPTLAAGSEKNFKLTPNIKSNIPIGMQTSVYMEALAYIGYNVQGQIKNNTLFKTYGSKAKAYNSKVKYGFAGDGNSGAYGYETVNGLPNLTKFKNEGLVCGSFVTYVLFNYMPNVAGINTQNLKEGANISVLRGVLGWNNLMNSWIKKGIAKRISVKQDNKGRITEVNGSKTDTIPVGSIIVFSSEDYKYAHIAIYVGKYNGKDFVIHCGDDGPGITSTDYLYRTTSYTNEPKERQWIKQVVKPNYTQEYGAIKIKILNSNKTPLANAQFTATATLSNGTKKTYKSNITGSDGIAYFDKLSITDGSTNYTITETKAPSSYPKMTTKYITLNSSTTSNLTVNKTYEAMPPTGSLKINKIYQNDKDSNIKVEDYVCNYTDFYIKNSNDKYITATRNGATYTYTGYTANLSKATIFHPTKANTGGSFTIKSLPPGQYTVTEQEDKHSGFYPKSTSSVTATVSADSTTTKSFSSTPITLTINKSFIQYGTITDNDYKKVSFQLNRLSGTTDTGAITAVCIDEKNNVYQWVRNSNDTTYKDKTITNTLEFVNPSVHTITVIGIPVHSTNNQIYYNYKLYETSTAENSTYIANRYSYKEVTKNLKSGNNVTMKAVNSERNNGSIVVSEYFKINNGITTEKFTGTDDLSLKNAYDDIGFYITNSNGKRIVANRDSNTNNYHFGTTGGSDSGTMFKINYDYGTSLIIDNLPFGKYTVTAVSGEKITNHGFTVSGNSTKSVEMKYNGNKTAIVNFTNTKDVFIEPEYDENEVKTQI